MSKSVTTNPVLLATAELQYRVPAKAERGERDAALSTVDPTIGKAYKNMTGAELRLIAGDAASLITTHVEAQHAARAEAKAAKPVSTSKSGRPAASPVKTSHVDLVAKHGENAGDAAVAMQDFKPVPSLKDAKAELAKVQAAVLAIKAAGMPVPSEVGSKLADLTILVSNLSVTATMTAERTLSEVNCPVQVAARVMVREFRSKGHSVPRHLSAAARTGVVPAKVAKA